MSPFDSSLYPFAPFLFWTSSFPVLPFRFCAEAEGAGELMAMSLVVGPGFVHGWGGKRLQPLVAGHAYDVIHLVAIAPGQQSGLAEVGVAPEYDPGLWPILANKSHQQRQNGPAVPGITSIAGAQIAHQQVPTAEDVKREVAVMVVIPVKELTRLVAVHRNIGAVKIQHDFLGRLLMLLDKVVPEQLMRFDNGLPIHRLLHSTKRGLAGQSRGIPRGG